MIQRDDWTDLWAELRDSFAPGAPVSGFWPGPLVLGLDALNSRLYSELRGSEPGPRIIFLDDF